MKYKAFPLLLATTFLSTPVVAQTIPEINADYLNSLTGKNVTWKSATTSETDAIEVSGKYYKAQYNNVNNYEKEGDKTKDVSVKDPSNSVVEYALVINNVEDNNYGDVEYMTFLNNKITGDIENNQNAIKSLTIYGGAISNLGTIGNITADFIDNSIELTKSGKYGDSSITKTSSNGGAIANYKGTIGDITGDFIGNYVSSLSSGYGGAIYNYQGTIGNITGNFISNYASLTYGNAEGGAIYNLGWNAKFGNITGTFIGNYASTISNNSAYGGAIFNQDTVMGDISGDFIGNYVSSLSSAYGGAIHNYTYSSSATIGNITANFIGNHAIGSSAYGGAISNHETYDIAAIGNIIGNFIGNYVTGSGNAYAYGGAIYNNDTIKDIIGNFIGNYVIGPRSAEGGAIYNGHENMAESAEIGDIIGDFIDNYVSGSSARGGAIYNNRVIGNITGNFIGNHAYSSTNSNASGGAIHNNRVIGNITGDFIDNYAYSADGASYGGAISHYGISIGDIIGDFIGNYAIGDSYGYGGAIYNTETIGDITGDFIGNYISFTSDNSYAYGGAIDTDYGSTIGYITGDFINNYASAIGDNSDAYGGAIYSYATDMTFTSGKDGHKFSGNYTLDSTRGKNYNAIFMIGEIYIADDYYKIPVATFDTSGGGSWTLNDNIEGMIEVWDEDWNYELGYAYQYELKFKGNDTVNTELGTTTQYINMNNAIINAGEVTVENTTLRFGNYQHEDKTAKNWNGKGKFIASLNSDGTENLEADSVTSLTLNNAVFDISNGYLETVKLKKYSATDSFVHLDVDVDNMKSDVINVKGDVDGVTKLVIHATSDKDIRGKGQILFAESFGDTKGGETSFEVARVYKSPYLYDVIYEGVENTSTPTASKDNTWYFEMNDEENPNKDKTPTQPLGPIEVAPEVIGFESLTSSGLAQTNGMVYNIMRKVGISKLYC